LTKKKDGIIHFSRKSAEEVRDGLYFAALLKKHFDQLPIDHFREDIQVVMRRLIAEIRRKESVPDSARWLIVKAQRQAYCVLHNLYV